MSKRLLKYSLLLIFVVYLCLLTVPYLPHKEVSNSYKEAFQEKNFYSETSPGASSETDSEDIDSERVFYIDDNRDALLFRLRLMEEAQEKIVLSTFDFNADESGKDVMAALLASADRGVQVQLLVDGLSGTMDVRPSPWFQALASHENISIKIYNPVNFLTPWTLQARLHDKYLMIDDRMFLLGGRNTYDLFLGDYSEKKNIDRELFVYETKPDPSASIHQLQTYFESVWALPESKSFHGFRSQTKTEKYTLLLKERYEALRNQYPEAFEPWNFQEMTLPANKITLLTNPIQAEIMAPRMWYSIHQLMERGQQITIYTPYIICGREMYEDLTSLCQNVQHVEIITNDISSGANPWGCTDYLNQQEKIWNTGVQVYEYSGHHSSHTKAVLIDDRMSLIGSYNLDMRSTYQDTELMLAVDSPALNQIIRREAEADKTFSRTMTTAGTYAYGENYITRTISIPKQIFYAVLRVVIVPFRRFL